MTQAAQDMIYLASCAVNGLAPDAARAEAMDLRALYETAQRHMMTAITAMALESAGIRDPDFTQEKGKAVRKNAALDVERAAILARFEEAGIWYMPLKGALLKELYPKYGMRQMSDNDILVDPDRAGDIRAIMEDRGFSVEDFGRNNHDIYRKAPIYNYEMHTELFDRRHTPELYAYYHDVKKRLVKDADNGFGYHFTDEDFYLYMIAHDYKHYSHAGLGLRSLLDTYVYLRAKPELDLGHIAAEAEAFGAGTYERLQREAALALFSGGELSPEAAEVVAYMTDSGVYGTPEQLHRSSVVRNLAAAGSEGKYFLRRLFPPASVLRKALPTLDRHPWLIPFYSVWRLIHAALFRRDVIRREVGILKELEDR